MQSSIKLLSIEFLLSSSSSSLPPVNLYENEKSDILLFNDDFGIAGESSVSRKSDFPSSTELRKIVKLKCEEPNATPSVENKLKSTSEEKSSIFN